LGSSIIILGNGPSLNEQVHLLSEIQKHSTFCANRFYLWEHAFTPTYYACNYQTVIEGYSPSRPRCTRERFLLTQGSTSVEGWTMVRKAPQVSLGDRIAVRSDATVTGCMVQIAAQMNHKDIYLIGVDHTGNDHMYGDAAVPPSYDYFTPDDAWQTWRDIKAFYEDKGVHITDCTPNGQLNEILGYKPLEEVLGLVTA
jgi:hypothetical protein